MRLRGRLGGRFRALARIGWDWARSCARPVLLDPVVPPADALRVERRAVPGPPVAERLTILVWNLHRGYAGERLDRELARLVREHRPHMLLLQEVPVAPEGAWWERPAVAALLGGCDLAWAPMHRVRRPSRYYPFSASGQLTASRLPLRGVRIVPLPTVTVPKLGPDHEVARIALVAAVDTGAGPLEIANLHLENTAPPSGRTWQARAVVAGLDRRAPAIAAGDVNTMMGRWERVRETFAGAGFRALPEGERGPWPRLDHAFLRGVQGGARRIRAGGSDHRPLLVEVELPRVPGSPEAAPQSR